MPARCTQICAVCSVNTGHRHIAGGIPCTLLDGVEKLPRKQARVIAGEGLYLITFQISLLDAVHYCHAQVKRGDTALLPHLSLVEIDNVRLLLMVNHLAVRRLLTRSATFGDFPGN